MSENYDDSAQTLIIVALLVFGLAALGISHNLGASFGSVLKAAVCTLIFSAIAIAIVKWSETPIGVTISGVLAAIWIAWAPVLNSAAHGGHENVPFSLLAQPQWWTSNWVWWPIEIALVVTFIVCLYRWYADRY